MRRRNSPAKASNAPGRRSFAWIKECGRKWTRSSEVLTDIVDQPLDHRADGAAKREDHVRRRWTPCLKSRRDCRAATSRAGAPTRALAQSGAQNDSTVHSEHDKTFQQQAGAARSEAQGGIAVCGHLVVRHRNACRKKRKATLAPVRTGAPPESGNITT